MCDCFTCKNHNKPELCVAYYKGYIKACVWFLSWAKANKIKMGSIGDDDLGGLYAQIQCNRDESDCLCRELEREQKESAFVHNKIEFPEYNDNLLEEFYKQLFENGQDDDLTETALEQKE